MKEYFTGTDRFSEAHKLNGAMLSAYALRGRKSPPSVAEYVRLAVRFQDAGHAIMHNNVQTNLL